MSGSTGPGLDPLSSLWVGRGVVGCGVKICVGRDWWGGNECELYLRKILALEKYGKQ